jgi:phosphoribosylglycinamide formyltransferase 1
MTNNRSIAILISGRGSNMLALFEAIKTGRLNATVAIVISNRADATGIKLAQEQGYQTLIIPSKGLTKAEHEGQLINELEKYNPSLICLAGYMRLLSAEFIQKFPNQILNIHPSLLPAFPGLEVQQQAIDYGVKYSGCTVHFVDEGCDSGPIIAQAVVEVLDTDDKNTLAARILAEEHRIYAEALEFILNGNWKILGRRVIKT